MQTVQNSMTGSFPASQKATLPHNFISKTLRHLCNQAA